MRWVPPTVLAGLVLAGPTLPRHTDARQPEAPPPRPVAAGHDFAADVRPLLKTSCVIRPLTPRASPRPSPPRGEGGSTRPPSWAGNHAPTPGTRPCVRGSMPPVMVVGRAHPLPSGERVAAKHAG